MSGVYIRGMEMPKKHSYITITIWPNGIASYGLFDREEHLCNFQETKAVPVPEHGRLIDADELTLKKKFMLSGMGFTTFTVEAVLIHDIENAPTIIPAEEGE